MLPFSNTFYLFSPVRDPWEEAVICLPRPIAPSKGEHVPHQQAQMTSVPSCRGGATVPSTHPQRAHRTPCLQGEGEQPHPAPTMCFSRLRALSRCSRSFR